jgi:hypothetical protein
VGQGGIQDRLPDFDVDKLFLNASPLHESGLFVGKLERAFEEQAQGMTGDEYARFLV